MSTRISRTIDTDVLTCLVYYPDSKTTKEAEVETLHKNFKTEASQLKAAKEAYTGDGVLTAILKKKTKSELYSMALKDFIKYSTPVSKAQPKE